MNVVVIRKGLLRYIFGSKLTWALVVVWFFFVLFFVGFNPNEFVETDHWLVKAVLLAGVFMAGFLIIVLMKYNNYIYVSKIDNQNQMLTQRERLLTRINKKLQKQSEFLKLVTDSFSHPFMVIDSDTYEIMLANKAFYLENKLDINADLRGKKCYQLTHYYNHPCEGDQHPCPVKIVKETNKPVTLQHIHKDSEGQEKTVEINAFPVFDQESGKVKQVLEYTVDISERIREQNELAENEERLRTIITTSPDGIAITDMDGVITFASEKSALLLNIQNPADLIGQSVFDYLHPSETDKAHRAIKDLLASSTSYEIKEFKTMRKGGSWFYQQTSASLLYDNEKKPYGMILISRDITDRKITEDRLVSLNKLFREKSLALEELNASLEKRIQVEVEDSRKKDRMLALQSRHAAMGEMIGNIAHQWRQPLNAINLVIMDLLDAHKHGELDEGYLQNSYNEINNLVQNMSQTIDDFRNFFRPNKEKKVFEINSVIRQALSFTGADLKAHGIQVDHDLAQDILVIGHPNEMIQTFINIINNAKDALLSSDQENKVIGIKTTRQDGECRIRWCNNGGGIAQDELDKIFDPYYTTKPEGKGTGLGLFIAKTIIEKNMGGKLLVRNTDTGVCFNINIDVYREV